MKDSSAYIADSLISPPMIYLNKAGGGVGGEGLCNVLLIVKSAIVRLSKHLILFYFDPGPVFIQESLKQIFAITKLTNHVGEAKVHIL